LCVTFVIVLALVLIYARVSGRKMDGYVPRLVASSVKNPVSVPAKAGGGRGDTLVLVVDP